MIDSDNLRTASLYINNQLLSRGLLRDGQTIDFADPSRGCGGGGVEATMGKVMSVVNDLILRRDVRLHNFINSSHLCTRFAPGHCIFLVLHSSMTNS